MKRLLPKRFFIYLSFGFVVFLLSLQFAHAQLAGADTAPGSSCAGFPEGATRITADPDNDRLQVTLVCDGTNWIQEGTIVLSKPGDPPAADGGGGGGGGGGATEINDLSDAATNYTNFNMFLGEDAGISVTSGAVRNTALGRASAVNLTDGDDNTFVGNLAGNNVSTGYRNVAIGSFAGRSIVGEYHNTLVGERAGRDTDGVGNTFIGRAAGQNFATGDNNIILGQQSESAIFAGGDFNILIGSLVDTPVGTISNHMNIGDVIYGSGLYGTGLIGINDPTPDVELDVVGDINYTGTIVDVSDIRLKENISPIESPLESLLTLTGISFTMKDDPKEKVEYGVSAQDVQKVFPEIVHIVDAETGTLGVTYDGLIAPMIEAIKEQQTQIESLKAEIEELKAEQKSNTPAEP